jgi:hypothetical protein
MGFSPPKDSRNLSLEEKKNSYLEAQASNVLIDFVSELFLQAYLSIALMSFGQRFMTNMICPTRLRIIVFPPLPVVMNSLPLHQSVARDKVTLW